MPKGKYTRIPTTRKCKKCGQEFQGLVRACTCDDCKYTCPDCGGPKRNRSSTWCYPCSLKHRDTSNYSTKKAVEAACSLAARRKRSESLKGKNHPNWKGGISPRTYPPNFVVREIRKKLDEKCTICESRKNVDIHHRDFNKDNHSKDNLTLLCRSCHKTLHNAKKRGII